MQLGERGGIQLGCASGCRQLDNACDGGGKSISYEKGRSVLRMKVSRSSHCGNHGCFAEIGEFDVTVIIRCARQYLK